MNAPLEIPIEREVLPFVLPNETEDRLQIFETLFGETEWGGLGSFNKVQTLVSILLSMEEIIANPDQSPWPILNQTFEAQANVLRETKKISKEMIADSGYDRIFSDAERVESLFEDAWTTYSDDVYDHSVNLVRDRLISTGYDEKWFAGKRCFDGGCGTGRLAIAMALLGARQVVAVDIGKESLNFFEKMIKRYKLDNITINQGDVTDLSAYPSDSFDFVASNGVLHHTQNCLKGVLEHYRITAPQGCYWLYLYGAGGFYWEIYDRLKNLMRMVDAADVKRMLQAMRVRDGIIYTLLDNVFASRTYYFQTDILELLKQKAPLSWKYQDGPAIYDSMERFLATSHGAEILGQEGEVRIAITKLSQNN